MGVSRLMKEPFVVLSALRSISAVRLVASQLHSLPILFSVISNAPYPQYLTQ